MSAAQLSLVAGGGGRVLAGRGSSIFALRTQERRRRAFVVEFRSRLTSGIRDREREMSTGKLLGLLCLIFAAAVCQAEITRHGGSAEGLPHEKYIHVVNERDSPVTPTYIKAKDGVYIAAAIRKPKG